MSSHDKKRYVQLDALRGLASLSVVIFHYITRLKISESDVSFYGKAPEKFMYIIKYTPIRIIWSGHEAVILFFVLSGFVMTLPFMAENKPLYHTFLIKRVCRIYIPYVVVILFAIVFKKVFYTGEIPVLSSAFNSGWKTPENEYASIASHLILLGNFDERVYNGSIWSLIHEMRISIIFPFIVLVFKKLNFKVAVVTAIILSFISYNIISLNISTSSLIMTIHYTAIFLLGVVLAKYRQLLIEIMKTIKTIKMATVLTLAILIYTFSAWSFMVKTEIIHDWIAAAGSAIFIMLLLSWDKLIKVFENRILVFIGRISYSLYLWHVVLLYVFLHGLYGKLPLYAIFIISFITTIFVSWISHMYIELPAMKLGKILTGTDK